MEISKEKSYYYKTPGESSGESDGHSLARETTEKLFKSSEFGSV